jgi:cytochrome c5
VSTHDEHSSFIKTPQQLIVVVLASFLVPIIGIILLVQLVTGQPGAHPAAMTPEKIAERIRPVSGIEMGSPAAAPGARSGEAIVKATCTACHGTGVNKAPKIGDKNDWAPHFGHGLAPLLQSAIKGKGNNMPARGGDASLTDEEVARAVVFMANSAGANFKEPAAPGAAKKKSK